MAFGLDGLCLQACTIGERVDRILTATLDKQYCDMRVMSLEKELEGEDDRQFTGTNTPAEDREEEEARRKKQSQE
jgi:hypothetical protein